MKRITPKVENIQFLLVGVMLVLGGLQNQNFSFIGDFLILVGVLLFIYAFYSLFSKKHNHLLKLFAMGGELIGLLMAAYILYQNGSNYLHLIYLLATPGIIIAIVVHYKKWLKTNKPIH